ncbi:hypothetical protein [Leptospira interrogans]|uniref:ASCH domain-containing protein n=2 Tax=Leptospira interrogans TaxID=173 RepID=A0A0E2DAP9_LEPIR|nr:hypothetical protein [Leptospira interrogans]EKR57158.1 hypothetical protein LEP1GSC105_0122 [Leptospira interrogans str. UI 12758]EMM94289.1 hypothetical protein LEP1GSC158_0629 [Leptospira interrogans serovar Zanoni str. LT2156]
MILSFRKYIQYLGPTSFKEKILAGEKIHSIRRDEKDRWRSGRKIQMAYGVRTKYYECFASPLCSGAEKIKIKWTGRDYKLPLGSIPEIFIEGKKLSYEECEELSQNDGFESFSDFCIYFDHDFEGKIIHWTEKRYSK